MFLSADGHMRYSRATGLVSLPSGLFHFQYFVSFMCLQSIYLLLLLYYIIIVWGQRKVSWSWLVLSVHLCSGSKDQVQAIRVPRQGSVPIVPVLTAPLAVLFSLYWGQFYKDNSPFKENLERGACC